MKPYLHAKSSVKKFGGKIEDYINIHDTMDSTKALIADCRHRAIFHTAFGCILIERIFGHNITNSDGKLVSTRDIAEQHILEDYHGFIPTLQDFLEGLPVQDWMVNGTGEKPQSCKFMPKKQERKTSTFG